MEKLPINSWMILCQSVMRKLLINIKGTTSKGTLQIWVMSDELKLKLVQMLSHMSSDCPAVRCYRQTLPSYNIHYDSTS